MIAAGDGVVQWVLEKAGGVLTPEMTGVGIADSEGKLKAAVAYDMFTGVGGSVSLHSRIDSPHFCTRTFLFHIFNYPFRELKVKKVFGIVDERKVKVIRFNTKVGFEIEGRLKNFFPNATAIVMSMREEDCKWLKVIPRDY